MLAYAFMRRSDNGLAHCSTPHTSLRNLPVEIFDTTPGLTQQVLEISSSGSSGLSALSCAALRVRHVLDLQTLQCVVVRFRIRADPHCSL